MFRKYTVLTLLALSGVIFDATAIGGKGLTLAVAGTGLATKWGLENAGLDSKYAIGAGVLTGTAVGAALIRRDCHIYRKLMQRGALGLENAKQHKLVKDLIIFDGLKGDKDYARLVLDTKLRELYTGKYPYSSARNDLDKLRDDLGDVVTDGKKAEKLLYGSPSLTSLKKYFMGVKQNADTGEAWSLHYNAGNLKNDVEFKRDLVESHLNLIERQKFLAGTVVKE